MLKSFKLLILFFFFTVSLPAQPGVPNIKGIVTPSYRMNRTLNLSCGKEYMKFANDIIAQLKQYDISEQSVYYYPNKNVSYVRYIYKCGGANYDSTIRLIKRLKETVSPEISNPGYLRNVSNQLNVDTMLQYRNLLVSKSEMQKWKAILDTADIKSAKYPSYYSNYRAKMNQVVAAERNLKNVKDRIYYPYTITVMFYDNYPNKNYATNGKKKYREETYFSPSVAGQLIVPRISVPGKGNYFGLSPEINIYTRLKSRSRKSPSYLRVYGNLGIHAAEGNKSNRRFIYGFGGDASFENNVRRRWLIPYFGVYLGIISEIGFGNNFMVQPKIGAVLYAGKDIHWFANAGYLYPFKNTNLLEGTVFSTGLNFILWRN